MAEPDLLTPEPDAPAPEEAEGHVTAALVEAVSETIRTGDAERLRSLVGDLHEADLGELLEALDADDRPGLVELLGDQFDFTALTEVDESVRLQLLESLPTDVTVEGLRELDSDDAVYILEDMEAEDRQEILERLPLPERAALTRSLDFPEETAGRRMQTDFVAVPPFWTAGRTIDYLREMKDAPETFYEVYVIDPAFKLLGTVPLDMLLRSPREARLESILKDEVREVAATEDQEEAGRLFQRYNLVSAPVTDEAGRLVGVLTVDDIVDVIHQEADEDIKALAGVGDEELSDTVFQTARGRFPWLLVNLLTAFLAASVIGLFEGTIEQMVALAVLMPIVASMGGNAGTQAMTVTVRALAMRELGRRNVRRIIAREVLVGLVNGVSLAMVLGAGAGLWFRNLDLGVVIATALIVNMLVAGLFGTLVPLSINKLKLDPAVASGVFVTTVTDVIGFFAFLGLATWWFGFL
ncbi:magnesium transporter MgtE [Terrihabitans soli]|uniref:Magnesium transporter MgtE n=1 Tax=Terrihabitans soli TaxID=708113 RepID=A0A6S6QIS3_9HYPH|nr:magnesium transporter [Terrihabitans soli]BCJ91153.1 magnesium transporter MgtE [Terrihabitans soli]